MSELKKLIHKAAAVDSTILIYGDSGTGKEVVARLIHEGRCAIKEEKRKRLVALS